MSRNILVVHDSETMRKIITGMILADIEDAKVMEAVNDWDAMDIVEEQGCHLVLFPVESASPELLSFISEMRERPGARRVAFVVFTSGRRDKEIEKIMAAGASECLTIPCSSQILAETVNRVCNPVAMRSNKRYGISDATALLAQGEEDYEAAVINVSSGGMLCELDYYKDFVLLAPVSITLQSKVGEELIAAPGIYSTLVRMEVIESNPDFTPKRLRCAFVFKTIPEEAGKALEKVFAFAEEQSGMLPD